MLLPGVWKTIDDFMKLLSKPHLKEPITKKSLTNGKNGKEKPIAFKVLLQRKSKKTSALFKQQLHLLQPTNFVQQFSQV